MRSVEKLSIGGRSRETYVAGAPKAFRNHRTVLKGIRQLDQYLDNMHNHCDMKRRELRVIRSIAMDAVAEICRERRLDLDFGRYHDWDLF